MPQELPHSSEAFLLLAYVSQHNTCTLHLMIPEALCPGSLSMKNIILSPPKHRPPVNVPMIPAFKCHWGPQVSQSITGKSTGLGG